jgi:prolipoprotein diacylglyceryl transferase
VSLGETLDVCAPALPLAQAIGRWGNWFNQELFGRPTDLPWALKIDPEHRPARFADEHTFHPTFLYESLWNVALVALVLWIDRKRVLARGYLLAVYVAGYSIGRLWIEAIRVDPASEVGGLRVNLWVYGIVLILAVAALVVGWRRGAASVPTAEAGDGADAGEAETDDRSPLAAE